MLEHLSPSRAALCQHVKRASFQAEHIFSWGQVLIAKPSLPSPMDWGWYIGHTDIDGNWIPLWVTLVEAPKECR